MYQKESALLWFHVTLPPNSHIITCDLNHLNSMFCLLVVICEPSQLWHPRYVFFWYVSHSTTFYAQVCAVDSWSLYQSASMAIWLICRTHSRKWGFSWNKQCSAYHTIIPSHQAPGVTRKFDLSAPKQSLDYNLIMYNILIKIISWKSHGVNLPLQGRQKWWRDRVMFG